jgi:ABC-type bacteriocin/lantibiotic exporter with double-glycine peptidase domain
VSDLQRIRAAIATHQQPEPLNLEQLAWLLWRIGLPCRPVELQPHWWDQPSDIEAGLWISADQNQPPRWWLVQQKGDAARVLPLQINNEPSPPPALENLQLQALSIWPPLEMHARRPWREMERYLQLGQALLRAIPASLLRAAVWLLLPALLATVVLGDLAAPVAVLVALFSLMLGLVLDNQWHRLWLNRSERQRSALGLNAMRRVLGLPLPLLRQFGGSGALGLGTAMQQLGKDVPSWLGDGLPAACLVVCTSLMLLLWQAQLGLITSAATGVWLGTTLLIMDGGSRHRMLREQSRAEALRRGQELLESAASLRLAGAEQRALAWWDACEAKAQEQQTRLDWLEIIQTWIALSAVAVSLMAVLGSTPPPSMVIALTLVGFQLGSTRALTVQLQKLETLHPSWQATKLLMASPSEDHPKAADPGELRGELAVDQLHFRYGPSQQMVLKNVSFSVAAGSFLAVVGPSGSGKSTLLRLLLGFEQPLQGQILFDGRDARGLQHEMLRPQIGTVLQNARLVGGTVMEVIAAGRAISVEHAWRAAEQAGLAEEIRALPMGLQTLVAAGGSNLSGSQRQRLAIARALAGQPRLLLFDEPTSALDNRTQRHVLDRLEQLAITRVLVAHRLSTVRHADHILVLTAGQLVQQGSYEQLMTQPGVFAELMQRQTI